MRHCLRAMWREDEGVLSFEWVLVTTLLVISVVGGLAAARDAIIDELGDAAQAMLALDNSYTIAFPLQIAIDTGHASLGTGPVGLASDSGFEDILVFADCARVTQEAAP
jgi:hypothetical protein